MKKKLTLILVVCIWTLSIFFPMEYIFLAWGMRSCEALFYVLAIAFVLYKISSKFIPLFCERYGHLADNNFSGNFQLVIMVSVMILADLLFRGNSTLLYGSTIIFVLFQVISYFYLKLPKSNVNSPETPK